MGKDEDSQRPGRINLAITYCITADYQLTEEQAEASFLVCTDGLTGDRYEVEVATWDARPMVLN